MKNKGKLLIVLGIFLVLLLSFTASARKGVGIVWNTESEIVIEDSTHCVEYGVYNPWDEDVNAILGVSKDLEKVVTNQESDTKFVPAQTFHENAVPFDFCFDIANVYPDDCLIGSLLCAQVCSDEEIIYEGQVEVREKATGGSNIAAGSATSLGVSIPLKLKVRCEPYSRNWVPLYVVLIVILLIVLGVLLIRRKKKGAGSKKNTKSKSSKKKR